jgi:hypothetical protein
MLQWDSGNLAKPLTISVDYSPKLVRQAKLAFRSVQGYMRDRLEAYPDTLAVQLAAKGIKHKDLKDEILLQLVKQTTLNPSPVSELWGWELMCLLCTFFAPR